MFAYFIELLNIYSYKSICYLTGCRVSAYMNKWDLLNWEGLSFDASRNYELRLRDPAINNK